MLENWKFLTCKLQKCSVFLQFVTNTYRYLLPKFVELSIQPLVRKWRPFFCFFRMNFRFRQARKPRPFANAICASEDVARIRERQRVTSMHSVLSFRLVSSCRKFKIELIPSSGSAIIKLRASSSAAERVGMFDMSLMTASKPPET